MNIHRLYAFLGAPFRRRRMEIFSKVFLLTQTTSIVDLGGAPETWVGTNTNNVVLLNIDPKCLKGDVHSVIADAIACPFNERQFDVVFSNSLIEHLGTEKQQQAFATEVRRLARFGYFVQTPNKWFPIEPHYLAPFVQFVPKSIRPLFIRWMTPWSWLSKPRPERCIELCQEIRLLDAREMKQLFPDAQIVRERFVGLTKSLIAIRHVSGHTSATVQEATRENSVRP